MDRKLLEDIAGALVESLEKRQRRANQYVVVYKNKTTDEVIGYHADTFCSLADDILRAKRYAGEFPDEQLKIIWGNFQTTLKSTEEKPGFLGICYKVKEAYWKGVDIDNVYIDAVYLADGVPGQSFQAIIIDPKDDGNG